MGYKDEFDERHYNIMLLREHNKKTFIFIGKQFGISESRASYLYYKAKRRQKELYIREIRNVTGISQDEINALNDRLWVEFQDNNMIIAYLEQEYGQILESYRAGEPKSIYEINEKTPRPRKMHPQSGKEISIESFRMDFTDDELLLIQYIEHEGKSLEEISLQTGMSESKAKYTYRTAKQVQFRRYVKAISEKTNRPFDDIKQEAYRNCNTPLERVPYLKEKYGALLD